MSVVFWGTYDLGKPRTRILLASLGAVGVDVVTIHSHLWRGLEDKSGIGALRLLAALFRAVLIYPVLIARYLRAPAHDVVFVAYMGQIDVLILYPFARLRRATIVWDMFISLHDTVIDDRKLFRPRGAVSTTLWCLEWLGCRAAARVLMDTGPHARRVAEGFALSPDRVGWAPVGAEAEAFPASPPPDDPGADRAAEVLFYGQLIPLHGVRTILDAVAASADMNIRWRLIGSGQDQPAVEAFIARHQPKNLIWERWVDYEDLKSRIAAADVCLGVFGGSAKAASVVPNKVYQALSAGRPVITRDSPAMRELCPAPVEGVEMIPPEDAGALVDAVKRVQAQGFPPPAAALIAAFSPLAIGRKVIEEIDIARPGWSQGAGVAAA